MQDDDDTIVARVLRGEVDAYGALVDRHRRGIWAIAAAALGEREATSDLVQEIFVEAYFGMSKYTPGRGFGLWLRGVARNQVREQLRKKGRRLRFLQRYQEQMDRFAPEEADTHDASLAAAQRGCRETLPPHSVELLKLRYEDSLSHDDIARRLGRSMEAVKQLLYRVHLLLRDCIQKKLGDA